MSRAVECPRPLRRAVSAISNAKRTRTFHHERRVRSSPISSQHCFSSLGTAGDRLERARCRRALRAATPRRNFPSHHRKTNLTNLSRRSFERPCSVALACQHLLQGATAHEVSVRTNENMIFHTQLGPNRRPSECLFLHSNDARETLGPRLYTRHFARYRERLTMPQLRMLSAFSRCSVTLSTRRARSKRPTLSGWAKT